MILERLVYKTLYSRSVVMQLIHSIPSDYAAAFSGAEMHNRCLRGFTSQQDAKKSTLTTLHCAGLKGVPLGPCARLEAAASRAAPSSSTSTAPCDPNDAAP